MQSKSYAHIHKTFIFFQGDGEIKGGECGVQKIRPFSGYPAKPAAMQALLHALAQIRSLPSTFPRQTFMHSHKQFSFPSTGFITVAERSINARIKISAAFAPAWFRPIFPFFLLLCSLCLCCLSLFVHGLLSRSSENSYSCWGLKRI